jgi:hypothetical protein
MALEYFENLAAQVFFEIACFAFLFFQEKNTFGANVEVYTAQER